MYNNSENKQYEIKILIEQYQSHQKEKNLFYEKCSAFYQPALVNISLEN